MEMITRNRAVNPSFFNTLEKDLFGMVSPRKSAVAVNIKENEKDFQIEMLAPGVEKENIHIEIEGRKMTIKAEVADEINEHSDHYTRRDFFFGSFEKTFNLPKDVDEDHISAELINGILNVTISKPEAKQKIVKKIELK
jgi:HSP20 family protein